MKIKKPVLRAKRAARNRNKHVSVSLEVCGVENDDLVEEGKPDYYIFMGIKKFDELSDEEYLDIAENLGYPNNIEKDLETIFYYMGFDEEGYIGNNYDTSSTGKYIVPGGQEHLVYKFIENKKSEAIFAVKKRFFDKTLDNIYTSKEKLRFLNLHIEKIDKLVNANPTILYAFTQAELREYIQYREPEWFALLRGIKIDIHAGPFRGALLKGEGVAYSKLKQFIQRCIDEETEGKFQEFTGQHYAAKINQADETESKFHEPTSQNPAASTVVTFEDLLIGESKKIFPFLKKNYSNSRPREIAYMIFALIDLGYFDKSVLFASKTQLINAVSNSIKRTERRALSYHINRYDNPDSSKDRIIAKRAATIKEEFDSLS